MTKRSERLQVVLELAMRNEEAALKRLRDAQTALHEQQEQLAQLMQYQSDYQQQLRQTTSNPLRASQYQSSQYFLSQLGIAIDQQQARIEFCEAEMDAYRSQWQQLHQKTRGMDDFILQCQQKEQAELDKREQLEMDELACQRLGRGRLF
jgi:flagellar FliJ protein